MGNVCSGKRGTVPDTMTTNLINWNIQDSQQWMIDKDGFVSYKGNTSKWRTITCGDDIGHGDDTYTVDFTVSGPKVCLGVTLGSLQTHVTITSAMRP